jgi:hypothetical protein
LIPLKGILDVILEIEKTQMIIYKLYLFLFALKTATCSCNYEHKTSFFEKSHTKITKTGKFPVFIGENSGLSKAWKDGFYWTHNDSGGKPELYMVNAEGYMFDTLEIPDAKNVDWEDLAKDNKGNIYIGDFGNNGNRRKDLTIYKKNNYGAEKIKFTYADQTLADSSNLIFDCEAFFWKNDSLYLFTKSWNKGKKLTKLYVLSDKPGDYQVWPKDQTYLKTQVSGADISPDGSRFALITYGKILIYNILNGQIDFKSPQKCIKIGKNQTEAVVFENDKKIIFSNEQRKIYSIEI